MWRGDVSHPKYKTHVNNFSHKVIFHIRVKSCQIFIRFTHVGWKDLSSSHIKKILVSLII